MVVIETCAKSLCVFPAVFFNDGLNEKSSLTVFILCTIIVSNLAGRVIFSYGQVAGCAVSTSIFA